MAIDAKSTLQQPIDYLRRTWSPVHGWVLGGVTATLFFVWLIWPSSDASERATRPAGDAIERVENISDWSELRAELAYEIEARERLEREVGRLQARVDELDTQTSGLEKAAPSDPEDSGRADSAAATAGMRRAFDGRALIASGIDPEEAEALRALWEEMQMERIYLTDQAEREGWAGTGRHRAELRALETDLRDELGPEDYDRYLFATGKKNRARVTDVIDRSAGAQAGFNIGDTILSYDGERIFNVDQIRKLTSSGSRSGSARVEVVRGDETVVLDVPRGPIGLLLMPHLDTPR